MEKIISYIEKLKEWFRNTNHKQLLLLSGAVSSSIVLVVVLTLTVPKMLHPSSEALAEIPVETVETETITEIPSVETEPITEITETTLSKEESKKKYKPIKNIVADKATGDKKKDEDGDGNKGADTSAPPAPPPIVSTPDIDAPVEENSKISKLSYVATNNLVGWQKAGSNLFYFDDAHELTKGNKSINGVRYLFNDYGAKASKVGIDVSNHNGNMNWNKVKASGIDYAIIRVGFRGYGSSGTLKLDNNFDKNISGAIAAGIDVGVYFYSQATNIQEAIEEASIAINYGGKYKLSYPIYFDTEYATSDFSGRADKLSKSLRTDIAIAFCETVKNAGYKAGIYASKTFFDDELQFSRISSYHIWVAQYTAPDKPTNFKHPYKMWQYTDKGRVDGIPENVDLNISTFDYAKNSTMGDLGQDVIFVKNQEDLKPFVDAENAIKTYETEKTFSAYTNALSLVNSITNDKVKSVLSNKLSEIKKKIENETTTIVDTTKAETTTAEITTVTTSATEITTISE
ncbi:MAG: glycoside hydrolase family 25 protein [Oscillospiraceae bacterium]